MPARISDDARKKLIAVVTWIALASVLGASLLTLVQTWDSDVASAHLFRTRSKITFHYRGANKKFYGKVKSERRSCRRNRRVILVRARRGISDRVLDRDRTNRRGKYRFKRDKRPKGRFYVVVAKRIRTTGYGFGPHRHKCKRDRSRRIKLPRRR